MLERSSELTDSTKKNWFKCCWRQDDDFTSMNMMALMFLLQCRWTDGQECKNCVQHRGTLVVFHLSKRKKILPVILNYYVLVPTRLSITGQRWVWDWTKVVKLIQSFKPLRCRHETFLGLRDNLQPVWTGPASRLRKVPARPTLNKHDEEENSDRWNLTRQ